MIMHEDEIKPFSEQVMSDEPQKCLIVHVCATPDQMTFQLSAHGVLPKMALNVPPTDDVVVHGGCEQHTHRLDSKE